MLGIDRHNFTVGLLLPLVIFLTFAIEGLGQSVQVRDARKYENRQRAARLILLRSELKSIDDAPMRCFLRAQIVRFIVENEISEEFDFAKTTAVDCFDDIKNRSGEFSESQSSNWRNTLLSYLRRISAETSLSIEKKYFATDDSSLSDLNEIDRSQNIAEITTRTISKISKGEVSGYLYPIYSKVREKDAQAGIRILDALLVFFERTSDLSPYADTLNFFSSAYLEPGVPVELTKRFFDFTIRLGVNQLANPRQSVLYSLSRGLLKFSLPKISVIAPSVYQQALSVYSALDGNASKAEKEVDEVKQRIASSNDRLGQTIIEAKAAESKALEDELWLSASQIALKQKKFQVSVDCILNFRTENESARPYRDYFLLNEVLPAALKDSAFDAAKYSVERIQDRNERGSGLLKIATRYLDLNDRAEAFVWLENALKMFENSENTSTKVRMLLSAVPLGFKLDQPRATEISSVAIKVANRLPTPGLDDKVGTASRLKYVDTTCFRRPST